VLLFVSKLLEMSRFNRSIVVEILCCQQLPEDFDYFFIEFLQFQVLSLDILEILGAIITRKELSVSQLEHSIGTCISSLEQIRDQSTKVTMPLFANEFSVITLLCCRTS
jgi:hypothetical protein